MKKATKKAKRILSVFLSIIMVVTCMTCSAYAASSDKGSSGNHHGGGGRHDEKDEYSYDGSIVPGSYKETYYVVPKSGVFYASDTFSFKVKDDGSIKVTRVKQKCHGFSILNFDYEGYDVVDEGNNWIKVDTYWYSNKEISIGIPGKEPWAVIIPAFKDVTCHYTIYADGTVHFDSQDVE